MTYCHAFPYKKAVLGLAVLLFLLWPGLTVTVVEAQSPSLTVNVTPDTLTLSPGQTATVTITVSNPTETAAEALALSWFTNTPLQVELLDQAEIDNLPPGADAAWTAQLKTLSESPESGLVHWRLDYAWPQDDGTAVRRVLFDKLTVSPPALKAVEDVASVTVASTLATLSEQRPGTVNLILENKQDAPLEITALRASESQSVSLTAPDEVTGTIIAPRRQTVIPIDVEAEEIVQPGKQLLLFEIDLAWQENGLPQQSTLVATHEIDVGVFGESQILTLLGVPAFFLLPGFLFLVAFKMAWGLGKSGEETNKWPWPGTSVDFWAVAITLSLLAAVIYPFLTQRFGVRRDYLQAYGLQDVLYLWFGAVIAGVLTYGVYRGARAMVELYKRWQLRQQTPAVGDSPGETIKRLRLQKLPLARETAVITLDENPHRVFYLQDTRSNEGPAWVAPLIYIANRDQLDSSLVTEIETAIYEAESEGSLEKVEAHLSQLRLIYHPDWPLNGPYQAADEELTQRGGQPQSIVSFQ